VDRALLESTLADAGEPSYRASQVWEWVARGVDSYEEMTNLPGTLRERLAPDGRFVFDVFTPGADDIAVDQNVYEIVTEPSSFSAVRNVLEEAGVQFESADLTMRPTNQVPVEEAQVPQLMRLIEALEDNDDVQAVHANLDVDADVLERAMA